jgi:hypothetical protein
VKSYVTNTINLSCAKILLPSVIKGKQIKGKSRDSIYVTLEQFLEKNLRFEKWAYLKKTKVQSAIKDAGLYFVSSQQLLKYILKYVVII